MFFSVKKTWKNLYWILAFSIIYFVSLIIGIVHFHLSFPDLLPVILGFGVVLPSIAYIAFRNADPLLKDKPVFKRESVLIFLLICWLIVYITYGSGFINRLIPAELLNDEKINFFIIILKKLIVFVAIPFLIYRSLGFRLRDFGFTMNLKKVISRSNVKAFVVLSVFILAFQYFFSGGTMALRAGDLKFYQLAVAFPLTFIWLFVEAGLVEEFFFRALLQSRIGVLFKCESAGIVVTVLLFALAHAPGLYLRGSSGEGISEPMSLEFWIIYCLINMSTAGIFLGITWTRTKNLYLVIGLHAITDLLPNMDDFIHIWHI